MSDRSDYGKKLDKLSVAMLMLITALRGSVKVSDGKQAIASIPTAMLDMVENIIKEI